MLCNMTYLGNLVTLTLNWPEVKFDLKSKLTFRGQVIYSSIRLDETNTMVLLLLL